MSGTETAPKSRRRLRDWAVDVALFLSAVAYGVAAAHTRLEASSHSSPGWFFDVDQAVGAMGCALLWIRRRRPVVLALVLVALSAAFEFVSGAMLVSLFTVAVHERPRKTIEVFLASVAAAFAFTLLHPEPGLSSVLLFLFGVVIQGSAVSWGMLVHHQRQLVRNAAAEANLLAEQAQLRAREAVAREMHDVLGHRLSLLSVYAGALEFRPDAAREDIARMAAVIRESAHQALQDLREVIGVLRAPEGELPQPTLADVHRLVSESCRAGMRVELLGETLDTAPESAGRCAYRVVQEALTNVRKHAFGAGVSVRLNGKAGQGITVLVVNSAPGASAVAVPPPAPDAPPGQGLVGLAERVALCGGQLEYGSTDDGGWKVKAYLPWP